ncbi:PPA1309 family protein [Kitasatospora sp. NBC_01287]|uniref:PPA1309 family protein n=1 Tax=Kitasatospora sp. NBC_01287 TaxID=2903573 RepID=UPI00224D243C|nr:PPA1309 family protein [Kitasatospora sp. NBC_01287]MCX4746858.1 PPA1309 family protein [Kitasatospora sp. NBC_01287]
MSDAQNTPAPLSPAADGLPPAATPLTRAALEIDEYVAGLGWDKPARLFALVDSARLRRTDPAVAKQLGLEDETAGNLTPVEQDELPDGMALDEFLGTIAWPDMVTGCALVVERLMLPPGAEKSRPAGATEKQLADWVANHPSRQEVRITAAVLRDGKREIALRLREKDLAREVLTGPDLVPGLTKALLATFA